MSTLDGSIWSRCIDVFKESKLSALSMTLRAMVPSGIDDYSAL